MLKYKKIMRSARIAAFITIIGKLVLLTCFVFGISACHKDTSSGDSYGTYSQSSGNVIENDQTILSSKPDMSAVKVTGGSFGITTSLISSSGNSSSTDNSNAFGLNAVMLAYGESDSARINSSGNDISSTGTGASGFFAYGKAMIITTGDKLTQSGDYSRAIMSSGGGAVKVLNDTAFTSGASSSAIATDKGGGKITIVGGTYTSGGSNSAAVYSTGTIKCSNATLTANGAEALVIDGSNRIELINCVVKSAFDKWGSLLFQSSSVDASGVQGYLTMTGGSFTYTGKKGGMFYNTNSTANYSLNGVTLSNSCDTLIRCVRGSWGSSQSLGGGITNFVGIGQTMSGLIHADAYSKISIVLMSNSNFTGAINNSNTGNLVTLSMDYTSKWILTAASHISGQFSNPLISGSSVSNITGNGFNVYYKADSNPSLGGLTFTLVNGGQLIPE
jgi:hypothetical protein